MAVPDYPSVLIGTKAHYYGGEGSASVTTPPSSAVTKVTAIISQTSGGAAIATVSTTAKTDSDQFADRWALSWPTTGITSSPYYVRVWATNAEGDGPAREVAPYIYFPPSIELTAPADGSTLQTAAVTMEWTATDDYGISYQRASVSHGGAELWGAEVFGSSCGTPRSVVFESGESYTFSLTARNGKGLESTATSTVSFSFVPPASPVISLAEFGSASVSITVTEGTDAGAPATERITVQRVNADDTAWTIAAGLGSGDTVIDPLPPLGVPVVYRAVAYAATGATSTSVAGYRIKSAGWALNFGIEAQELVELAYNPQANVSLKHGGEAYHFADGGAGGGLPVFYPTTDRDYSGSLGFDTILNADTDRLLGLCDRYPVAWLRDPFGHRWRAHVSPSVSHGVGLAWSVMLSWSAVKFEEAWDG